jgi:hypothetical protein
MAQEASEIKEKKRKKKKENVISTWLQSKTL